MSMQRLPNWQDRLSAAFARAHAAKFEWGEFDCCLWAADAVLALTGVDPAAGLRGQYSGPLEAYRVVRSMGGLAGIGSLGGPPIAPLAAMPGDIGLVRVDKPMLAVCAGAVWMVAATKGLHALPLDAALMAWRV